MYINEKWPLTYHTEVQCLKIVLSSYTFLVFAKSTSRKHELVCSGKKVIKLDSNGQSNTEHFLGIRAGTGGTLQTKQGEYPYKSQKSSLGYEKGFS